jgi:2-polyprenyl-3-methyl-5-hydroxy-6-metoxy-1,4-benzoquinol methylase
MPPAHHDVVRREFERQADGFGHRGSLFAARGIAEWIEAGARLQPGDIVLDAGGGAGDLSRSLAGRARQFVVADLTGALREVGRDAAEAAGVDNVLFVRAELEDLPFPDRSFDVVLCRFVVHHLAAPSVPVALAELRRVCRPGGRVVVADLVALDDGVADRHNALERLRDPSHTTALTEPALVAAVGAAGLEVRDADRYEKTMGLDPWLERAHTAGDAAGEVRAAFAAELGGGAATGLCAGRDADGSVTLRQRWVRLVATPV